MKTSERASKLKRAHNAACCSVGAKCNRQETSGSFHERALTKTDISTLWIDLLTISSFIICEPFLSETDWLLVDSDDCSDDDDDRDRIGHHANGIASAAGAAADDDDASSFLVLACDGVWDELSDQEAVDLVRSEPDIYRACVKLRDYTYLFGSEDNISVIIIRLSNKNKSH